MTIWGKKRSKGKSWLEVRNGTHGSNYDVIAACARRQSRCSEDGIGNVMQLANKVLLLSDTTVDKIR